jgi:hypothetical protein
MVRLAGALASAGKGSDTLFKLFEINFIKHRKYIASKPKLKQSVLLVYFSSIRGSNLLYEAITNPNIEIPSVDGKIPLMDRISNYSIMAAKEQDLKNLLPDQ